MEWNRDDENPLVGDNFESIIAEARLAIIDSGDSINFFVDSVNVIDGIGIYPGHIIATHTEWGSNGVAEFGAAVVIKIDDEGNEEDKFIDNILPWLNPERQIFEESKLKFFFTSSINFINFFSALIDSFSICTGSSFVKSNH